MNTATVRRNQWVETIGETIEVTIHFDGEDRDLVLHVMGGEASLELLLEMYDAIEE